MERVIYNQLESYLSERDLLCKYQSGFRTSFSTDSCLVHLTDYIRLQMDRGVPHRNGTVGLTKSLGYCESWHTPDEIDDNGIKQHCSQLVEVIGIWTDSVCIREELALNQQTNWLRCATGLHFGGASVFQTESIMFDSRKRIVKRPTMDISCGGTEITSRDIVCYLGSLLRQTLDGEQMLWQDHGDCNFQAEIFV